VRIRKRAFLGREKSRYILGVRLRRVKRIRETVLSRDGRYWKGADNLRVKEIEHDGEGHLICLNPEK
jgi:hypothetical protein